MERANWELISYNACHDPIGITWRRLVAIQWISALLKGLTSPEPQSEGKKKLLIKHCIISEELYVAQKAAVFITGFACVSARTENGGVSECINKDNRVKLKRRKKKKKTTTLRC